MPRLKLELEDKIMQLGKEADDWKTIRAAMDSNPNHNLPRKLVAQKQEEQFNAFYNTEAPFVYEIIDREQGFSNNELITYIKDNVDTVLNKYDGKNLFDYMAHSMQPVENKDNEHDELVYIHNKLLEIQSYKNNDGAKINFIASKKGEKKPHLKDVYQMIAEADPSFKEIAFRSCEVYYTEEFKKAFGKKDGNLDEDRINKYVKDTYTASSEKGKDAIAYGLGMNLYAQFAKK